MDTTKNSKENGSHFIRVSRYVDGSKFSRPESSTFYLAKESEVNRNQILGTLTFVDESISDPK